MSPLRIFGLIAGAIAFSVVFLRLRRHAKSRGDVVVVFILGSGLIGVSLFPALVSLPTEVLSLGQSERGRLLTLLILSSVALWGLLAYERLKAQNLLKAFDGLVRRLAVERFLAEAATVAPGSVVVLIPSYNEEENLPKLLRELPKDVQEVPVVPIVIDDGSDDGTARVCEELGVRCARNPINRGGGAALRAGFDIARVAEACVIVTIDGDGQHRVEDIAEVASPVISGKADVVIGSRMLGDMERYSAYRRYGVMVFGKMVSVITGCNITDPASGFRALAPRVLEACTLVQDQYHTAELLIEAAKHGVRIIERPILIKRRNAGLSKKGKNIRYPVAFLKTIIRTWLR